MKIRGLFSVLAILFCVTSVTKSDDFVDRYLSDILTKIKPYDISAEYSLGGNDMAEEETDKDVSKNYENLNSLKDNYEENGVAQKNSKNFLMFEYSKITNIILLIPRLLFNILRKTVRVLLTLFNAGINVIVYIIRTVQGIVGKMVYFVFGVSACILY